jgi:hypothetical protein
MCCLCELCFNGRELVICDCVNCSFFFFWQGIDGKIYCPRTSLLEELHITFVKCKSQMVSATIESYMAYATRMS